jgi:threonine dehydrogenase-like Zn-dependent dehydrogenase
VEKIYEKKNIPTRLDSRVPHPPFCPSSANLGAPSADCSRLQQTTVVPVVPCSACSACRACREGATSFCRAATCTSVHGVARYLTNVLSGARYLTNVLSGARYLTNVLSGARYLIGVQCMAPAFL